MYNRLDSCLLSTGTIDTRAPLATLMGLLLKQRRYHRTEARIAARACYLVGFAFSITHALEWTPHDI